MNIIVNFFLFFFFILITIEHIWIKLIQKNNKIFNKLNNYQADKNKYIYLYRMYDKREKRKKIDIIWHWWIISSDASLYNGCIQLNDSLRFWRIYLNFFQEIVHRILYKIVWKELFQQIRMGLYWVNTRTS